MMIYRRLLSAAVICVALLTTTGTAKAEIVWNDLFSVSFESFNDCTGELMLLELDVHIIATEVETSDGTIRFRQSVNTHGWGVGLDSGDIYRYKSNTHFFETDPMGIASIRKSKRQAQLIGLGKTPNQRRVVDYEFVVDEFGIVTNVYIVDVICQGD